MLNGIRNINFGWIIIVVGIIMIISGFSMTEGEIGNKTLLCFDSGCLYIQGISNISIGLLGLILGIYLILKK